MCAFANHLPVFCRFGTEGRARLALKVSLELRYDNLPAVQAVPVEPALDETVLVELEDLDSTLKVALVVTF